MGFPMQESRRPTQQKSRLASIHSVMLEEANNLAFCPAAIVAVGLSQKGAVAAVSGFQQRNVRIRHDLSASFRQQTNKRIIRSMDDQGRERDLFNHAVCARASVIILRAFKAAV